MTQRTGMLKVLGHELAVVRGLRIGPDLDVADASVIRERELLREIAQLEASLENVVAGDEDEPIAVSFSKQAKVAQQVGQKEEEA